MQIKVFLLYLVLSLRAVHATDSSIPLESEKHNTLKAYGRCPQGKMSSFNVAPANAFLTDAFLDEKFLQSPLRSLMAHGEHGVEFINYINKNFIKTLGDTYFSFYTDLLSCTDSTPEQRINKLAALQGYTTAQFAKLRVDFSLVITKKEYPERIRLDIMKRYNYSEEELSHYEPLFLSGLASHKIVNKKKWVNYLRNLHLSAPFKLREFPEESLSIKAYIHLTNNIVRLQKKHNFPLLSAEDFSKIFTVKMQSSLEKIKTRSQDKADYTQDPYYILGIDKQSLHTDTPDNLFETYADAYGNVIQNCCRSSIEEFDRIKHTSKPLIIDCIIL